MKLKITNKSLIRWSVFLLAIISVSYFLPKNDQRKYAYEINRPWNYSLLTAPFDIPIYLDSIQAGIIKDSIDNTFAPIYYRDKNEEKARIEKLTAQLKSDHELNLTTEQRNRIINEVQNIYETGLVDFNTYTSIRRGKLNQIRILSNNSTITINTSQLNSSRIAYAHIDSVLSSLKIHNTITAQQLADVLRPNILADTIATARFRNEAYQSALAPIGVIQQGERIIDKGDIVTPRLYTILRTYEQVAADRGGEAGNDKFYTITGQILFLMLLFGSLYLYLYFFRPDYYEDTRISLFLILIITTFVLFAFGLSATFTNGLYIVPFTIVPIIVLIFLDSRTAFFSYLITIMISTIVSRFPIEYILVEFLSGFAAIVSIKDLTRRSQLIRTAAIVFATYCVAYTAIELMQVGSIGRLTANMFGCYAINALLISFAYILIFIIEKLFGFTSRVTLVELSDINNPILRELSEECPGTFQHSMSVSNLASAAAHRIGANVQLVRAGALYHDIGKISNPIFFTENQHGVNPHDGLDPMQSARIVIGHVADGLKRAEKAKLPSAIRDFISEHHGRGKARYFYTTYCNAHPDMQVDEAPFTYPGPNPRSRETSILMMADAVEAASRSLSDHTPEAISALVNRIIDTQINEGLHNDSSLSFRDVNEIKETFASRLRTMYHARVSYPEAIRSNTDKDNSNIK